MRPREVQSVSASSSEWFDDELANWARKRIKKSEKEEEVKEELQFSSASVANVSLLSAELKIFENAEEEKDNPSEVIQEEQHEFSAEDKSSPSSYEEFEEGYQFDIDAKTVDFVYFISSRLQSDVSFIKRIVEDNKLADAGF